MSASALSEFQSVREKGWRRGLGNLLQGEYSAWFKSSKWWKHLAMWFAIINVMMVIMIITDANAAKKGDAVPQVLFMYGIFGGMFVAFGVMVIMQRVLIGEKHAGTAAWVLSKPVTRTAFVTSRLVINSIAILLTSVIVPGVIFYISLGLFSSYGWLSPLGFFAGLLVIALHTFFWIVFVWMIGTLFESSAIAIGIPIALFFLLWTGSGTFPWLVYISPLLLSFSPAPEMNALSVSFMLGEPVFSWLPLILTAAYSIVFIIVAILRFNRQEF